MCIMPVFSCFQPVFRKWKPDEDGLCDFYDNNGSKLNPDLAPKPGPSLLCKKDNDPKEEILNSLNRLDQVAAIS